MIAVMCDVHHGDCLAVLRTLPDESVDSIVTDPPYGLSNTGPDKVADTIVRWAGGDREHVPEGRGFMGRPWDAFVPPPAVWDECLRVLKPGGHMLVFAGSRTQDLMGMSIRLAGFELRDSLAWIYGSGFPKSMDVSKAIDKDNGRKFEDRFALGRHIRERREALGHTRAEVNSWLGAATKAEHYESDSPGFARVPTLADWRILRERLDLSDEHLPLVERVEAEREVVGVRTTGIGTGKGGTAIIGDSANRNITAPATPEAERWAGWGTALKPAHEPILLARKPLAGTVAGNVLEWGTGALNIDASRVATDDVLGRVNNDRAADSASSYLISGGRGGVLDSSDKRGGRWPANVLLDEHAAEAMDQQSGHLPGGGFPGARNSDKFGTTYGEFQGRTELVARKMDAGGASRFFHVFKYQAKAPKRERPVIEREDGTKVAHPTVKPLALMEWLVTLVTPPGGTVLDPFAGSGTTLQAARDKGFRSIGIEADADHVALIRERLEQGSGEPDLFTCGSDG